MELIGIIGTLIVSLFNSVFIYKTFKKSKRLEFIQRRDHLSQKISELNNRNTEARLLSAKYVNVVVKLAGLPLRGEQAEENAELIASIKDGRGVMEKLIKIYDDKIEEFHVKYRRLTLETDATEVERMIATVQVASEDLRKDNSRSEANLYVIENSNEVIKTTLAETDEKQRQIDLDFERAMEKLK